MRPKLLLYGFRGIPGEGNTDDDDDGVVMMMWMGVDGCGGEERMNACRALVQSLQHSHKPQYGSAEVVIGSGYVRGRWLCSAGWSLFFSVAAGWFVCGLPHNHW